MIKLINKIRLNIAQHMIERTKFFDIEDKQDKAQAIKTIKSLKKWNSN